MAFEALFQPLQIGRVTILDQPRDVIFQVAAYVAVGILGNHQRCAGMMHEHVTQPPGYTRGPQYIRHLGGYVDAAASAGWYCNRLLLKHSSFYHSLQNRHPRLRRSDASGVTYEHGAKRCYTVPK